MKPKQSNQPILQRNLRHIQHKLTCFEDDVLPHLPSKEAVLARAKHRQYERIKKKRTAVTMLAVVLCGIAIYGYNPMYDDMPVQTAQGKQGVVNLQDGSIIHLNAGTKIRILQRLRSQEVILEQGEARFEVAHAESKMRRLFERSFQVHAGRMHIVDIGTVFDVFKHNASDATVAVVQGEIAVNIRGKSADPIYLQQGQSMRNWQEKLIAMPDIQLDHIQAWPRKELYFDHTPLYEAITHFQRYHDFKVDFSEKSMQNFQITGQFKAQNYQQFIQVLPMLSDLKVNKISENYWRVQKK